MSISFIVTASGTINAVAGGKSYVVARDHTNYDGIRDAIHAGDVAALERLANVAKTIVNFSEGKVEVRDGIVYYENAALHNTLTQRILGLIRDGFPFKPMLLFLNNLMENPSYRAVQELYGFLEHQGLPITEDGCFLGYKRVRPDYTDNYSGKYRNMVGDVNEVPRRTVDDNWRNECSSGFHVGSIEYVRTFHAGTGHVMIVKVNPADVVSVPPNEVTKMRVSKYVVVQEYDVALLEALPDRLHTAQGTVAEKTVVGMGGYGYGGSSDSLDDNDDNDDDDFDDEDDDFEDEDEDDFDDEDDDDDDEYEHRPYRGEE